MFSANILPAAAARGISPDAPQGLSSGADFDHPGWRRATWWEWGLNQDRSSLPHPSSPHPDTQVLDSESHFRTNVCHSSVRLFAAYIYYEKNFRILVFHENGTELIERRRGIEMWQLRQLYVAIAHFNSYSFDIYIHSHVGLPNCLRYFD